MTDRELLELAARAAGFGSPHHKTGELQFCWTESEYPRGSGKHGALWNYQGHMSTAELWNPLEDDGDALRLAVKLGMGVHSGPVYSGITGVATERNNGDPYAATRRAITRAAAEIARGKS